MEIRGLRRRMMTQWRIQQSQFERKSNSTLDDGLHRHKCAAFNTVDTTVDTVRSIYSITMKHLVQGA